MARGVGIVDGMQESMLLEDEDILLQVSDRVVLQSSEILQG
jgi:hypothetical protein